MPRKVIEWAIRKLGIEEWLVRAVMAIYKHVRTRVRSYDGSVSEWFGVNVGVHQWRSVHFTPRPSVMSYLVRLE